MLTLKLIIGLLLLAERWRKAAAPPFRGDTIVLEKPLIRTRR